LFKTKDVVAWVGAHLMYYCDDDEVIKTAPTADTQRIIKGHVLGMKIIDGEVAYTISGIASKYYFDLFEREPKMSGERLHARMMRKEARTLMVITGFVTCAGCEDYTDFLENTVFPIRLVDND